MSERQNTYLEWANSHTCGMAIYTVGSTPLREGVIIFTAIARELEIYGEYEELFLWIKLSLYPRKLDIHVLLTNNITGINQGICRVHSKGPSTRSMSVHTLKNFFPSPWGIESKQIQQYLSNMEDYDSQNNLSCWLVCLKNPRNDTILNFSLNCGLIFNSVPGDLQNYLPTCSGQKICYHDSFLSFFFPTSKQTLRSIHPRRYVVFPSPLPCGRM